MVRFYYEDFRTRHGVRPTASEMYHEGFNPRSLRGSYGSWLRFVGAMGDLQEIQADLVAAGPWSQLLDSLEITPMTRSFKMLVLETMLDAGALPGELLIGEICDGVTRLGRRSACFRQELGPSLDDKPLLRDLMEKNPIAAWVDGKGTGGTSHFEYHNGRFRSRHSIGTEQRDSLAELVREIVDWRLAEYVDRAAHDETGHVERPGGAPAEQEPLEIGQSYMRAEIPAAAGLEFSRSRWEQGFVFVSGKIFLLVTLEKDDLPAEHRYEDRFISRETFLWKSQTRHTRSSPAGRMMSEHVQRGTPVHLFVRRQKKIGSKAAPFIYCGELEFESWEGDRPITIHWHLRTPLSDRLSELFGVR